MEDKKQRSGQGNEKGPKKGPKFNIYWIWAIIFAVLSIIAGIILLFSPVWGVQVILVITGIALVVLGVVQIVRAFTFGRGATAA